MVVAIDSCVVLDVCIVPCNLVQVFYIRKNYQSWRCARNPPPPLATRFDLRSTRRLIRAQRRVLPLPLRTSVNKLPTRCSCVLLSSRSCQRIQPNLRVRGKRGKMAANRPMARSTDPIMGSRLWSAELTYTNVLGLADLDDTATP